MKFQKNYLFGILILLMIHLPSAYAIPAFPGAEGYGSDTVGGRGGTVMFVTNLNDSGPGSFREAVTASGPRIVLFKVSGNIELQSQLQIKNPYITIAGHSSPGGICIAGEQTTIRTHDVIIRHMRFRLGQANANDDPNDPNEADALDIWGNEKRDGASLDSFNVIIDHCSISWGSDECMTVTYSAHDFTISWCMIYGGLHTDRNHSKGLAISNKLGLGADKGSIHHNFFASSKERNPYLAGQNANAGTFDLRNNVTYNYYGGFPIMLQSDPHANIVHNFVKPGPESNPGSSSWPIVKIGTSDYSSDLKMIYVLGNLGNQRDEQSDPEWCVGKDWTSELAPASTYQKTTPYPIAPLYEVTTTTMSAEYAQYIVDRAGATKPYRDSADIAIAKDYKNGTGSIPTWKAFPSDYPVLESSPAPVDSDLDGMPDDWELDRGLNIRENDSAGDINSNGYTNIEEYLHCLASDNTIPGKTTGLTNP